jgi:hypothetical protein
MQIAVVDAAMRHGELVTDLRPMRTGFLMDAAETIANYSTSLVGQPAHHLFQGDVFT